MRQSSGLRGVAACPLVVVVALCGLTACSSPGKSAHRSGTAVEVSEGDFHIVVNPAVVPAGKVLLTVHNSGPDQHELIVVRLGASSIPLRADGITVDEDALEKATVGALEPGTPGSVRRLSVKLRPGRYEVFCNMSGHYLGGMYNELTVS